MERFERFRRLKERYADSKLLILPSIHAVFCTLVFMFNVLDIFFHLDIFSGYFTIGNFFNSDYTGNGMGFTRRFIIVSWSGVACWPSILFLLYKKRKAFFVSFIPLVFLSLTPAYLSVFGTPVSNYYSAVISVVVFIYLFMVAVFSRKHFE